jgi:hypothetical protein
MRATGRINPITNEEIMEVEERDLTFLDTNWDDLTIEQKAIFCSLIKAPFLSKENNHIIKAKYEYLQKIYNNG